jgi:hypothetical protein
MELWIRSQDKTNLILAKDIVVRDGNIKVYKDTELCTTVAMYKTKERALEVLDEIHQRLIDIQTFEHMIGDTDLRWLHKRAVDCVYIMPKE